MYDHCPRDGTLCDSCLRYRMLGQEGVAMTAGQKWARDLRAKEPGPIRWWPRWDDATQAARDAAYRRGVGAETHPQVRDALARACWDEARVEWLAPAPRPGDVVAGRAADDGLRAWLHERDERGER